MNDFTANEDALCRKFQPGDSGAPPAPCNSRTSRRDFLAGMGLGGAAFALSPFHLPAAFKHGAEELLFCVGSFGAGDSGTLRLLHIQREKPRVLYTVPSQRPSAIARHPYRSLLYVANDISRYQHHLRGTVETFSVDQATGTLELIGRQPLSLSATRPRSLAVSPDGQSLLVAAYGGGAYNVLPIDESGLPGAPSTILKQVGRGEHPSEQASAHPAHVLFHPRADFALAADYGADRLDVLAPDRGDESANMLKVAARIPCVAGSGPSRIAVHRGEEIFVVAHTLRPALAIFHVSSDRKITHLAQVAFNSAPAAICFHPEHDILFAAQNFGAGRASLTAWRVSPQRGTLESMSKSQLSTNEVTEMHASHSTLWLGSERGLFAVELDRHTAEPFRAHRISSIPDVRSMAVL